MTVPEDFTVSLFAGEPDVHQPIAFAIDDRGRLWVAECFTYPKRLPFEGHPAALQGKNGSKILIFEDTDGDGKFDKKNVYRRFNLPWIEVGRWWVGAALSSVHSDSMATSRATRVLLDG
jgi:hypothetical protein